MECLYSWSVGDGWMTAELVTNSPLALKPNWYPTLYMLPKPVSIDKPGFINGKIICKMGGDDTSQKLCDTGLSSSNPFGAVRIINSGCSSNTSTDGFKVTVEYSVSYLAAFQGKGDTSNQQLSV